MKSKRRAEKEAGGGEEAGAAAAGPAAEAPVAGTASRAKRRRRGAEEEGEAPERPAPEGREQQQPEGAVPEELRRSAQREIQRLVAALRSEGKSEREIQAAKRELKAKFGPLRQPQSKQAAKGRAWRERAEKEREGKLAREHELVVIPVLWRGRQDKEEVLRAAQDVKECVAQQGVDVWLDARRHYTPGQKFAHWEYRGVMLRVEVGPEDVRAGVCRVCRARTPGDHLSVERRSVRLPPAGARRLLLQLKDWGLSRLAVERRATDDDDDDDDDESSGGGGAEAAGAGAAAAPPGRPGGAAKVPAPDEVEGNWAPRGQQALGAAAGRGRGRRHGRGKARGAARAAA